MIPMPGRWNRRQLIAGAAVALVVIAIGAGLLVLGPPSGVRARRLDERRVADLREWTRAIDDYWTHNQRLPAALDEITMRVSHPLRAHDPVTREPYRYAVTGAVTYELCAVFERASDDDVGPASIWNHGAGLTCFAFEAPAGR